MISSKAKKILLVSAVVVLTGLLYGILEALLKFPPNVPRNWPYGYFYAIGVYVAAFLVVYYVLRKYGLLSKFPRLSKFSLVRLFVFLILWITVEDFSYWVVERAVLPWKLENPFPVNNWWADYFFFIGAIAGTPFLFSMPLFYFITAAIFALYLIFELKIRKS